MKKDIKPLLFVEITLLFVTGLFLIDFLPRNYNEFQRICTTMWAKDPKQYQICMDPYFQQTNIDKFAIGAGIISLTIFPIFFLKTKK